MGQISVIGFGLKGFGNILIEELVNNKNVNFTKFYTRKEKFDFLYYDCSDIESLCENYNVKYDYINEELSWNTESADLAIISSFHRVFKKEHIEKFKYVINIHPSLLPSYKGATPTNWSLLNNETIVGLTAHIIDEKIDEGNIIFQEKLLNPYITDSEIRKSLAFLSRKIINEIISCYPNYQKILSGFKESFSPKRQEKDSVLSIDKIKSINQLIGHIKAFTNYPMPKIKMLDGRIFIIDYLNPKDYLEIEIEDRVFNILGYWCV